MSMTKKRSVPEFDQVYPGIWRVAYRGHEWRIEARRGPLDVRWALFRDNTFVGTATDIANASANIAAFEED